MVPGQEATSSEVFLLTVFSGELVPYIVKYRGDPCVCPIWTILRNQ